MRFWSQFEAEVDNAQLANVTKLLHQTIRCKSSRGCSGCGGKYQTSLFNKASPDPPAAAAEVKTQQETLMCSPASGGEEVVTHPVIVIVIASRKCCASLDTGSGAC